MNSKSFLGVSLSLLLVLVVESLSLKPVARVARGRTANHPLLAAKHSNLLFNLRGGDAEAEGGKVTEKPVGTSSSILSLSSVTATLVAMGQFYSNSLESFPILTKSVTVSNIYLLPPSYILACHSSCRSLVLHSGRCFVCHLGSNGPRTRDSEESGQNG